MQIRTELCTTIFQNVVFYARFLFWLIVTFIFVAYYEAFLQDELFGCGQGRSPRLRQFLCGLNIGVYQR